MDLWLIYAVLAALFAGVTAVLAKAGLSHVHADLGLTVRTAVIFVLVLALNFGGARLAEFRVLPIRDWVFLAASGVATTLSWVFYNRAVKAGPVTYVAAIDKGSILVTLILAFFFLGEPVSPRLLAGSGLILAGLLVLVWK